MKTIAPMLLALALAIPAAHAQERVGDDSTAVRTPVRAVAACHKAALIIDVGGSDDPTVEGDGGITYYDAAFARMVDLSAQGYLVIHASQAKDVHPNGTRQPIPLSWKDANEVLTKIVSFVDFAIAETGTCECRPEIRIEIFGEALRSDSATAFRSWVFVDGVLAPLRAQIIERGQIVKRIDEYLAANGLADCVDIVVEKTGLAAR